MADTPDLSKIVSIIMENPGLIEQISALVKSKESAEAVSETAEENPLSEEEISEPVSAQPKINRDEKSERRIRLLSAMKPYLSSERSRALDTMMSLSDILGAVRR